MLETSAGARSDTRFMANVAACLFAAGSLLGLSLLALGQLHIAGTGGVLTQVVAPALCAVALWRQATRLPRWSFQPVLALGTAFVTYSVLVSPADTEVVVFYLWPALYAAYFFKPREAGLQLALIGLAYAAVTLFGHGGGHWLTRWINVIGTLSAAAAVVAFLRARVDRLVARLSDAAATDALTSVLNRRGFQDRLESELERSRRRRLGLAVIAADVDHFKVVNDVHGHPAGDDVLRLVAHVLRTHKRQVDTVGRLGGEEFAVVAPDTDLEGARVLAERLRDEVERASEAFGIPVTISAGVAVSSARTSASSALLKAADRALYTAKELGRNRVVVAMGNGPSSSQYAEEISTRS